MTEKRRPASRGNVRAQSATQVRGWFCALLLTVLGLFAAWRVLAIAQSDRLALSDPVRALQWIPSHPQALLSLSERHLAEGRTDEAKAGARRLLAVAPLEARGFTVLARAAAMDGHRSEAARLYAIAAQRGPRDLRAQAWLIEEHLLAGRNDEALTHIGLVLKLAPWQADTILPWLARLAADPAFANRLAVGLQSHPPWRPHLLLMLHRQADARARDAVFAALSWRGDLSDTELAQWVTQLLRQGRWNKAYAVWASRPDRKPDALSMVFNGDFESDPSGWGFDWHQPVVAGVSTRFAPSQGSAGRAAHTVFRNRIVQQVDLEQPLLLAPGPYRFSARMRATGLRNPAGLQWSITCDGHNEAVAVTEPVSGSFDWREVTMDVDIPRHCSGQWLRLEIAPGGTAQATSGNLWFDEISLRRRAGRSGTVSNAPASEGTEKVSAATMLQVDRGHAMVSRGGGFDAVEGSAGLSSGDRVLVLGGSIAQLSYGENCTRRLPAEDVYFVADRCPAGSLAAAGPAPVNAARLAAELDVVASILCDAQARPPVPAGR